MHAYAGLPGSTKRPPDRAVVTTTVQHGAEMLDPCPWPSYTF